MQDTIFSWLSAHAGIGFAIGIGSMFTIMACVSVIIRGRA